MNASKKSGSMDQLFYEMQLNGPSPDKFICRLEDIFTPEKIKADHFFKIYTRLCTEGRNGLAYRPGLSAGMAQHWVKVFSDAGAGLDRDVYTEEFSYLHHFTWMRDLKTLGPRGLDVARALLDGWMTLYSKYDADIWAPYLTGERLLMVCFHGQEVLRETNSTWRAKMLTSFARQLRHLARTAPKIEDRQQKLISALALTFSGLTMPHHGHIAEQGANLLQRELRLQLRNDGGHVSRNPSFQLRLAVLLQSLYDAYKQIGCPVPNFIQNAVGRVTGLLEFYKCTDGLLPVFNGSYEGDAEALSKALAFEPVGWSKIEFAAQTGYQRLQAGKVSVLTDLGGMHDQPMGARPRRGAAPVSLEPADNFDGAFAFQLMSGRKRIVVNCGNDPDPEWAVALRQPAAHSTACVQEEAPRQAQSQRTVPSWHRLREDAQGQFLEMERQLADATIHRRRLFLSSDGDTVRGEDLWVAERACPDHVVLRFHLYPGLTASLLRGGNEVLIVSPQKEGWRFKASRAIVTLDKSIYTGVQGQRQRAQQIVVRSSSQRAAQAQFKWAFNKEQLLSEV